MAHELRLALRSVWRSKTFAFTALVAFSFGIAATAIVFSVIDSVLLRPATFANPDSVVVVQAAERNKDWDNVAPWAYESLRSRTDLFSEVAASRLALFTVTRVPAPDQVFGLSVSGRYFAMIGDHPWRGRLLTRDDDRPGAPPAALLSYKGWQRLFASDPNVIGKTAQIDGDLYTVVGIMQPNFVLPDAKDCSLWTTLRLTSYELAAPNARGVSVTARLQPGVTIAAAQAALNGLASTLSSSPEHRGTPFRFRVTPWRNETESSHKLMLWLAMGMVSGLLLIACANISSILLARSVSRRREYAIRLATGASRMHLIRQSLLEICLIALAAVLLACSISSAALHFIREHLVSVQAGIPNLARIHLNTDCLLFSFAVALFAAMICGLFPAVSATSIDLSTGLRESGAQISSGRSVRRFLYFLVGAEAGISMVLLLTSGLLVRSLVRLMSDDHGLRPDRVLTLRLPTGSWQQLSKEQTREERQARIQRYLQLLRQVETSHGVEAAAMTSSLPLSHTVVRTRIYAPNQNAASAETEIMPICQTVTRDYFRVMGIPLLSGRTFDVQDAGSKLRVALVNQAFARKYLNGDDPTGKMLRQPDGTDRIQIIGVVRDSPHLDFVETVEPEVYLNFEQTLLNPFLTGLVVRTRQNPEALVNTLRSTLSLKDAHQPVVHVATLKTLIDDNVWQPRFSAWLFSTFAAVALCLSAIGIYGVVAYVTTSERRDFGIRLSLGASRSVLFRFATRQSLAPVVAGVVLGILCSYWTSKSISSLLYRTGPLDPGTTIASAAILVLVALAATAGPALRASRVDPVITLRCE